jgi:hypothetical protein
MPAISATESSRGVWNGVKEKSGFIAWPSAAMADAPTAGPPSGW